MMKRRNLNPFSDESETKYTALIGVAWIEHWRDITEEEKNDNAKKKTVIKFPKVSFVPKIMLLSEKRSVPMILRQLEGKERWRGAVERTLQEHDTTSGHLTSATDAQGWSKRTEGCGWWNGGGRLVPAWLELSSQRKSIQPPPTLLPFTPPVLPHSSSPHSFRTHQEKP